MVVKRAEARTRPCFARSGAPAAGSGVQKVKAATAKGKYKGPHWSPVEILVSGANLNRPMHPSGCFLRRSWSHAHGPMCVPSCAQAAAHSGVYVNERHQTSTLVFREIAADKAFPGMLEQLCGSSGKHTFHVKECGRGANRHNWTLAEAKLRPEAAGQGAVYRHFKGTLAYTRNVLNPLYIALCVKGAKGELSLPSGWQMQDMIDAIKYNLANGSKVDEDLDSAPLEGGASLGSASETEARLESSAVGGAGVQPAIAQPVNREMQRGTAMANNSPAKLSGSQVLMMLGTAETSGSSGPATPNSDPEYKQSQSSQGDQSEEEQDDTEEEVARNKPPRPNPPAGSLSPVIPNPNPQALTNGQVSVKSEVEGGHSEATEGAEQPGIQNNDVLVGKDCQAAIKRDGVLPDLHFQHLLTWLTLGPMGTNDPHFAITPSAPCSSDTAEAPPADSIPSFGGGASMGKNKSRQDQRDAERQIAGAEAASAVHAAGNTSANRAAHDAAQREILDVTSRVTLTHPKPMLGTRRSVCAHSPLCLPLPSTGTPPANA